MTKDDCRVKLIKIECYLNNLRNNYKVSIPQWFAFVYALWALYVNLIDQSFVDAQPVARLVDLVRVLYTDGFDNETHGEIFDRAIEAIKRGLKIG